MNAFEKMSMALLFVTLGSLLGKFVIEPLWQQRKSTLRLADGRDHHVEVTEAPLVPDLASLDTEKNFAIRLRVLGLLPDDEFVAAVSDAHNAAACDHTVKAAA